MPGVVTIEGAALQTLKGNFRRIFNVDLMIANNACAACQSESLQKRFFTEAGRVEHRRTGFCEQCWDTIVDTRLDQAAKQEECTRLTTQGVEVADLWISVSKAKNALQAPRDSLGRYLWELALKSQDDLEAYSSQLYQS